ncbi:MAG: DnaD domain protein [Clostridia bacterium]|nr:DnaD domain protein [Clostridia bacterium]
MKLEQNDKSMLFSSTEIPDVFFTEYLSCAKGDYVKVYLYILFLSKYDKDIKINDLSKKLSLPLKVIQEAFKYWEEAGVLIKKHTGYVLVNLQETELLKLYSPKLTSSPEDIKKNAKNQYRAKAIENINNQFFQGIMSPSWYNDIDMWFKKYNFDEQVMLALFNYCFDHSALHRNYIQVVADSWFKNNIRSFSDLDKYYEKQEKISSLKKSIIKKLGLNRNLTVYEDAYVEKWAIEYGYSLEIIEIALKKTTSKSNISFEYIDKIISDWHDRNLKTVAEIQEYIKNSKIKQENIKDLKKQTNYNNSNQRSYDNFDNLYANN